ncbi:MAG TPA: ABC transporter permease [Acidimicrobiia bacterium]|nr:ABC transporter permease [Acidimicrobiia bacterium]
MSKESFTKVVKPRSTVRSRVQEIWRYRELLIGMIRKELKVKYKNSILGFFWTMLNPALYIVIFWLVFTRFIPNGIPEFVIFFASGLLVWNLFVNSLNGATSSVVANAGIVKKVYFPREILPLSAVGASIVHYLLQVIVLIGMLFAFQHNIDWTMVWLLPIALVTLIIFVASLGILLSAVNVYARDMQHLLELILLAWFWITPVVYYARKLPSEGFVGIIGSIIRANPISAVILTFQRVIYNDQTVTSTIDNKSIIQILPDEGTLWYLKNLGLTLGFSLVLFYFAMRFFDSAQGNFAEEL